MVFVSLVGTQIFGTLNPLLALLERNKRFYEEGRICLLATPKVRPVAEKISHFLAEKYPTLQTSPEIITISTATVGEQAAPQILQSKCLTVWQYDPIYFNAAGGMNYLSAACVWHLPLSRTYFLYPERGHVLLFKPEFFQEPQSCHVVFLEVPSLPPETVLELQGISGTLVDAPKEREIDQFFDRLAKALPKQKSAVKSLREEKNALEVPYGDEVLRFERCFARNNELYLVKILPEIKDKKALLAEARKYLLSGISRELLHETLHKNLLLLTDSKPVADRFIQESRGKIKVVFLPRRFKKLPKRARCKIQGFFKTKPSQVISPFLPQPEKKSADAGKHLVFFLGKESFPVLKALYAHQPKVVWLLYDQESHEMDSIVQTWKKHAKELPFTVHLVGTNFLGTDVLKFRRPGSCVEANITTGHKAQALFLTIWAKQNDVPLFSLRTRPNQVATLWPPEKSYPVPSIDIEKVLTFSAKRFEARTTGEKLLKEEPELQELAHLCETNSPNFLKKADKLAQKKAWLRKEADKQAKKRAQPLKYYIPRAVGDLWEDLVALMVHKYTKKNVLAGVKFFWDKQENKEDHRTENDILFEYEGGLYLISCKVSIKNKYTTMEKTAQEAEAMANVLGRFTMALVAVRNFDQEEALKEEIGRISVSVFGPKVLGSELKFLDLLKKTNQEKQKTRQP